MSATICVSAAVKTHHFNCFNSTSVSLTPYSPFHTLLLAAPPPSLSFTPLTAPCVIIPVGSLYPRNGNQPLLESVSDKAPLDNEVLHISNQTGWSHLECL